MSEEKKLKRETRRAYEAPAIIHEEPIESVAVVCDPADNPGLPVKNDIASGCQPGFLNS